MGIPPFPCGRAACRRVVAFGLALAALPGAAELQNVEVGSDFPHRDRYSERPFTPGGPTIDIALRFEPGVDGGQGMGSLFELRNTKGQVVLGAGFDDAHSTYMRDNNRQIIFYYRAPEPTTTIVSLRKPFGPENNGTRLQVDGGELVAFFRYGSPVQLQTPVDGGGWSPVTAPWTADAAGYCGTQWVNNKRMIFQNDSILYDGAAIYTAERSGGRYFYDHGVMFIYHHDPDQLFVVPWKPGETISLDGAEVHDLVGVVFTWGMYNGEFLLTTNVGEFYSYRDGNLTRIRATDGTSWQGYSMLRHYDKVLIGQYPTGSLYQYDENGLKPFDPPIPVPEGVSKYAREAQTLAIYGGYLYAGVWPWGELWRFDHEANSWSLAGRMFARTALTAEDQEPYARAMKDKPAPYNYWGQRITSLTNFQNSLYIATMNKQGGPWLPEVHDFLDEATVAEYGAVHKLTAPAQIAAPFTWKERTELGFHVEAGDLILYQGTAELGRCGLPSMSPLDETSEDQLAVGNGIYGPARGKISLVHFRRF